MTSRKTEIERAPIFFGAEGFYALLCLRYYQSNKILIKFWTLFLSRFVVFMVHIAASLLLYIPIHISLIGVILSNLRSTRGFS